MNRHYPFFTLFNSTGVRVLLGLVTVQIYTDTTRMGLSHVLTTVSTYVGVFLSRIFVSFNPTSFSVSRESSK